MKTDRDTTRKWWNSSFSGDIAIGMSDGLIVVFALAAGLSAVVSTATMIVWVGLAEIIAGGFIMAIGGYLAGLTPPDEYLYELAQQQDNKKENARLFFDKLGIEEEVQANAFTAMEEDEKSWVDNALRHELSETRTSPQQARKSAFNIGTAYATGGLIPLIPYCFTTDPFTGLVQSAVLTLLVLFAFGFFKGRVIGINAWGNALRMLITGAVAAGAVYLVAGLFRLG